MIEVETKYHVGYCQFDDINEANAYMKDLREKEERRNKLVAEKKERKDKIVRLNDELNAEIERYNKDYGTNYTPYYNTLLGICNAITGVLDSE